MHPGQSAAVMLDDRHIGRVGRLHPMVEKALDTERVFIFELDGSAILQQSQAGTWSSFTIPSRSAGHRCGG